MNDIKNKGVVAILCVMVLIFSSLIGCSTHKFDKPETSQTNISVTKNTAPEIKKDEIKIAIGEWAPFIGENLPSYGVIPAIMTEIFEGKGIHVTYGFFPWSRSYTYVESAEWNASAIWGKTEEREVDCLFSDVLYRGESVLFFLKNKPLTWTGSVSDLKGLNIGLPLGSAKGNLLEKAESDGLVKFDIGGDQVSIYKKLLAQRIDAVDETKSVGWNIIQSNFSKDEINKFDCTTPYEIWDYSVIFSKKIDRNAYYLKIFNEGLQEMKKNGRLDAIWESFYKGDYNIN